jgi:hypothetical protein
MEGLLLTPTEGRSAQSGDKDKIARRREVLIL